MTKPWPKAISSIVLHDAHFRRSRERIRLSLGSALIIRRKRNPDMAIVEDGMISPVGWFKLSQTLCDREIADAVACHKSKLALGEVEAAKRRNSSNISSRSGYARLCPCLHPSGQALLRQSINSAIERGPDFAAEAGAREIDRLTSDQATVEQVVPSAVHLLVEAESERTASAIRCRPFASSNRRNSTMPPIGPSPAMSISGSLGGARAHRSRQRRQRPSPPDHRRARGP